VTRNDLTRIRRNYTTRQASVALAFDAVVKHFCIGSSGVYEVIERGSHNTCHPKGQCEAHSIAQVTHLLRLPVAGICGEVHKNREKFAMVG
jgi:hypothetical protein